MFTGIIELAGRVAHIEATEGGVRLDVEAPVIAAEAVLGASVAVNGVCLTLVHNQTGAIGFDVVPETLQRTNLGDLRPGDRVNLERPMLASGRFDGHVVQGHVDGTGILVSMEPEGNSYRIRFQTGDEHLRYTVEKGSITVDGISLTVAALGPGWFEIAVIPHTWRVTNLSSRLPGDRVNLEVDILAKYVERLLSCGLQPANLRRGTDTQLHFLHELSDGHRDSGA